MHRLLNLPEEESPEKQIYDLLVSGLGAPCEASVRDIPILNSP